MFSHQNQSDISLDVLNKMAIDHIWPVMKPFNRFVAPGGFTFFTKGKGCYITDSTGKKYLDIWSAIMFNNIGWGRKEIVEAVYNEMMTLHFPPTHELTISKVMLSSKLAEITPGSLSKVHFSLGGTDAVETALKVAWKYQRIMGFPSRQKIIGGYTYHGSTFGAMGTGWRAPIFHWNDFPSLVPGMKHVASPYCSKCDFKLTYPACDLLCARQVEWAITREGPETVAAFIEVPIPAQAHIPPPEYWPMIRSICDKYGILLILDEVQSGFGRFGKMFACEHFDVVPDILVMGKALTSGYIPMSAVIVKKEVSQKFEGGFQEILMHSFTFEGSPVACVAALENIRIIETEKLVENSAKMGEYLFDKLQSLYKHKIVGEVRGGLGLNCEIELFKDKESKERFSPDENGKISGILSRRLREEGLWGYFANPLPVVPPLIISSSEIDEIVFKINKVIGEVEEQL